MHEVLVATPLRNSAVTRPYDFEGGISIRELSPILWDISIVKSYISEDERAKMAEAKYWLCASQECEHVTGDTGIDLFASAMTA